MAIDKAIDSTQLNSDIASIADAIRAKGGTSALFSFPDGFISAISNLNGVVSDTITVTRRTSVTLPGISQKSNYIVFCSKSKSGGETSFDNMDIVAAFKLGTVSAITVAETAATYCFDAALDISSNDAVSYRYGAYTYYFPAGSVIYAAW